MVVVLRPIFFPFALAFCMPLRTLALMIANSSSAKTALIWMNAWLMGSICPFRQSTVILPTMMSLSFLLLMTSTISQSCCVLLVKRLTSSVMMVSPSVAALRSI